MLNAHLEFILTILTVFYVCRRLAELVRQQHRESEEREREGKRKWDMEEEEEEKEEQHGHAFPPREEEEGMSSAPLDLIKVRLQEAAEFPVADHNAEAKSRCQSPTINHSGGGGIGLSGGGDGGGGSHNMVPNSPPGSAESSSSGSESGREVKRRRLDELLFKKFEQVTSMPSSSSGGLPADAAIAEQNGESPPLTPMSSPPSSAFAAAMVSAAVNSLNAGCHSELQRQLSSTSPLELLTPTSATTSPKHNRRKPVRPSNPNTPPSLSLRPPSDLFPSFSEVGPMAASSPSSPGRHSSSRPPSVAAASPLSHILGGSRAASPGPPPPVAPLVDENDNKDLLKSHLLQVRSHHSIVLVRRISGQNNFERGKTKLTKHSFVYGMSLYLKF